MSSSSSSGTTSTAANDVCLRLFASNGEIRTSRCTPCSAESIPYANRPWRMNAGLLMFDDLDLAIAPLCPAQIHMEQHVGPILRLGAACSRVQRHDRGSFVVLS